MMEKRNFMVYVMIVSLLSILAVITASSQEDITTVQDTAFTDRMRYPVVFLHDDHNDKDEIEDCYVCHHLYEEGELVEDETSEEMECSECHELGNDKNPIPLVDTYHSMCKGCHLKNKAGPIMCSECHVKQK